MQVGDRLLKEILVLLSRDEARHFSFFADMIRLYLERYGEVIAGFRMPLTGTIKGAGAGRSKSRILHDTITRSIRAPGQGG